MNEQSQYDVSSEKTTFLLMKSMNPIKCFLFLSSSTLFHLKVLVLNKLSSMDKYEKIKKIGEGSYGKKVFSWKKKKKSFIYE